MEEVLDLQFQNIIYPRENQFRKFGVSPDIMVEEQNQFELNSDNDNQLRYAVKLFQS